MAVAPAIGIILVARVLAGAFAATFSTANAYIADISPPEKRAANFGLVGAAFGLGFIIGPGIGGLLGDQFGPRAPFYFVAALGAVNFVFGAFALPETLAKENRRPFDWKRANAFGSFKQFARYPIMDSIVLTYTLCSIALPLEALAEMRRVLKPAGKLIFCEHGKSPGERVHRWQRRVTPVWKRLVGGCHLDRDIPGLIRDAGFRVAEMDSGYVNESMFLRLAAFQYRGVAVIACAR